MAVLQMMSGDKHASFQQLANIYIDTLLPCLRDADTVVDVFDSYDNKVSVKSAEKGKTSKCRSNGKTVSSDSPKINTALEKEIWLHLKIRQHSTSSSLSITQKQHVNHNPSLRESW